VIPILLFFNINFAWSFEKNNKSLCSSLTATQKNKITENFKHNPFQMIESLVQIANGDYSEAKKNLSIELSFDLNMIYKQTMRHHQNSSLFKDPYMTKIKTNFFGLFDQLYKSPTKSLALKSKARLTTLERDSLKAGSILFTDLKRLKCTSKESSLLGCSDGYYVLNSIIAPELSCKNKSLKNSFSTKFYLTHSKKYGFKITDVELSGSRVVLPTFEYTQELKNKGYKKEAILARFQNLQNSSSSFKFPKRPRHSRSIMAIINSDKNRVPTSL